MAKKNKAVVFPSGRPPKGGAKAAKEATKKTISAAKEQRRQKKLELRRKEKSKITAAQWAEPAPSHLVAKLDMPKVKSKYQSYFEFAENTEKKEKKLEFQVTTETKPPPGFSFVPFGDPVMTNACKELSRERGAMIFVVSEAKRNEASKISAEIHRTGYHFREMIVDEAREIVGETVLTRSNVAPGAVEPIPESQDEINNQADLALRDLFPRIPNTDRQMIIEHAFKKGRDFHGEPTVGLQADLPLSRRVQLATLAHIRHTHTRYDKLLRETSWMNARKLVEPVCLDIIVKWRGDEETGRDQLDEILREVVIITDSEDEGDNDSSDDETTDEEGEITDSNPISPAAPTPPTGLFSTQPPPLINNPSRRQNNAGQDSTHAISSRTRSRMQPKTRVDNTKQRGFSRYQAAWDEALHRQQGPPSQPTSSRPLNSPTKNMSSTHLGSVAPFSPHPNQPQHKSSGSQTFNRQPDYSSMNQQSYETNLAIQPAPYYHRQHSRAPGTPAPPRNEVIVRQHTEHRINQDLQPRFGTSLQANDQRPPLVVRGSPQRYGLQDMLVPSIETAPNDPIRPLVRSDERRNAYESFDHRQESYPRPVMQARRPSPQRRQVIILDDDDAIAPQYKRRRVVHEDESGRFRPHPSFAYPSSTVPSADSHLISSSSVQTRSFIARDSSIHPGSSQGLSGNADYLYSPAEERIPIYDAPGSGYLGRPPEQFRRPEVYDPREVDSRASARYNSVPQPSYSQGGEHVYQRSVSHRQPIEHMTANEHNSRIGEPNRGYRPAEPEYQGVHPQRPQSPSFPVADRPSRSHDVAGRSGIDQGLIHDFSQSRIEGPVRAGDCFYAPFERSCQIPDSQSNPPRGYEEHVSRSFQTLPSARARSPVSYVERPIYHQEQPHRPVVYERRHTDQERYVHHEQVPILVHERSREPRPAYHARPEPPQRQVIVLE